MAAAAAAAAMYVAFDLLDQTNGVNLENLVITSIIHSWLAEKLIDNAVAVSRPGQSLHFHKTAQHRPRTVNPDLYEPPAGSADQLEWIGDSTGHFRLTSKNRQKSLTTISERAAIHLAGPARKPGHPDLSGRTSNPGGQQPGLEPGLFL